MNLSKEQLATQNAILLAVHKTDDIEEARKKEQDVFGCLYRFTKEHVHNEYVTIEEGDIATLIHRDTKYEHTFTMSRCRGTIEFNHRIFEKMEIIGLPPTLERVLIAIPQYGRLYTVYPLRRKNVDYVTIDCGPSCIVERELLNDDGTPASLRDQSSRTQEKIAELILSPST